MVFTNYLAFEFRAVGRVSSLTAHIALSFFVANNCCSKSGFVATLIRTEFRSHMLTEEALVANCHAKNTRQ